MKTCSSCERTSLARGLCARHYQQAKRDGSLDAWAKLRLETCCTFIGCSEPHEARGFCTKHYQRLRHHNDPARGRSPANGSLRSDGYIDIGRTTGGKTKQHILIAEQALGHRLPRGAVVHHVDENRSNNAPGNLVICPDRAYHNLIHQRMRALSACGHASWRKCQFCKAYDAPENVKCSGTAAYHTSCRNVVRKAHYAATHPER